MRQDTLVDLGTPLIGALVFGSASAAALSPMLSQGYAWTAFGAGMVLGWTAGHLALYNMKYPATERAIKRYELEALRSPKQMQPTTFILPERHDGFTPRISSQIEIDKWQAVAGVVVQLKSKNLTQDILTLALRELSQTEIRRLHTQMIALLIPAGVINQKGNHNEITDPEGRWFFLRMDAIKTGDVLDRYGIPFSPRLSPSVKNNDFTQHTRATRG